MLNGRSAYPGDLRISNHNDRHIAQIGAVNRSVGCSSLQVDLPRIFEQRLQAEQRQLDGRRQASPSEGQPLFVVPPVEKSFQV